MKHEFKIGDVVRSAMGRDDGKLFAVTEILDERFVKIADGHYHKLAAPKKKNRSHIKATEYELGPVAQKLQTGKKVFENELRSALLKLEPV